MAQLPPKIPTLTTHHTNWPHRMPPLTNILLSPSPHQPPSNTAATSWVDEFLDFTSARRGSQRRSMSDSIAFLEAPSLVEECRNSMHGTGTGSGFDRLDDDQLMSMFSDEYSGGLLPSMVGPASSPSDQNSNNDDDNNNPMSTNDDGELPLQVPKHEPGEVESAADVADVVPPACDINADQSSGGDSAIDPKRVKRILANRQSAQRSRVRKLQYISELERSVTTLQTEVSALSPRVAFLDHQRLILNVDNSAIKQRIAALAQDKIFKDAHQEAMKKEIERLRQIYQQQQQNLKKMGNNSSTAQPLPSSDHNTVCTDKEQLMT